MTITEIKDILESPYDRKIWKSFLQTQFTNNKLNAEDRAIKLADNALSKECLSLGNYEINEYTKIGIFEVQLKENVKLSRNRVGLRNLTKSITAQVAGAMVVFVQGDKWRFSYISKRKVKNKDTNLIENKETAPKRYTYLFGKGEKALTAAQRFEKLIKKQKDNLYEYLSLDDFEDAFSVEKLSKEFFAKYKEIYEDFVEFITGKRFVKKGSKWTEIKTHEAHFQLRNYFGNDEKAARDFIKRMLGRIAFLYFIQKKGWLAVKKGKKWGEGDPDYLYQLFHKAKYKDSFYSDYLVPLFFDTLNNIKSQDESNDLRFPYLNGGLFDKTQDFRYDRIALPAEIFEKLFETFSNYNFTIYEDGPDEQTVAVDPEMLGHIFENLLEDNKDKGAFYTPKDIVHYMCRESLHNYIYTYTGNEDNEDFKQRLQQYNDTYDIALLSKEELKQVERALEDVKICDPAIGSGAFPMGLLHEIYHLKIPIEDAKGLKAKSPADLKKHIIEESIYGIDIDSGAVDIARLRFWLSLVVDETEPQPLPNLAFKIVCANTLVPLGKPKGDLGGSQDIAKQIEKVRHDYFDASKEEKKDLERQFRNLQNKLWATAKEWAAGPDIDIYLKISEFDPFADKSCGWFDAWWMFGVKDGFDIVIGNPPYVGMSKLTYKSQLQKIGYQTFESTGDLYSIFYEKGRQLLKERGVLTYITSRQWINASYGKSLRKYFVEHTNPLQLIDFGKAKIFDSATVFVNILILKNEENKKELKACKLNEDFDAENEDLGSYFNANLAVLTNLTEGVWKIGEEDIEVINAKIEEKGIRLKDWKGLEFFRGITTGLNEAYHIDEITRKDLIEKDSKNAKIIKPLLRGKDIKKYSYNFAQVYTLFIPWHFPLNDNPNITKASFEAENVFKKEYPSIYNHLFQFKTELSERNKDETGVRYEWYAMQRYGANYWREFEKEKIIWIEISDKANYCLDTKGHYLTNSAYFISGKNLRYILALLNSKVADFYFFQITAKIAGGRKRYTKQYVEQIPIPQIEEKRQFPFVHLADYLLFLKNSESKQVFSHTPNERIAVHIEDVLNMMVYELYFEEHMKEVGLDVIKFVTDELNKMNKDKNSADNLSLAIEHFYLWLQTPDNQVRQRMNMIDIKSPDIISRINLSTQ